MSRDPMSRIAYLALLCTEPAALAGFYGHCFGLAEIGRTAAGDCTLTDGGFNLTLFKQRPQLHEPRMESGPHHLGIAVDNLDQTLARYRAFNPRGVVIPESGDLQHGDVRIHDLRHSFASLAGDIGYSEPTIAALVGHTGRSITSRYIHSADAVLLAAADAVARRIAELMGESASADVIELRRTGA